MTNKKFKVEFAPGAFDQFEGTQEELDQLLSEIQKTFAGKTKEEIEAMSRPVGEEEFDELPDEVKARLESFFDEDIEEGHKRKLQ